MIDHPRHWVWVTKEKERVQIKHMSTSHLRHTINMLERQIDNQSEYLTHKKARPANVIDMIEMDQFKKELYVRVMKAELAYRAEHGWPEDKNNASI